MTLGQLTIPIALALAFVAVACGAKQSSPRVNDRASASDRPAAKPDAGRTGYRVAITLDDLPFVGPTKPGDSRANAIDRIVAALDAHRAPVGAFVTCQRIESPNELERWSRAPRVTIGNHSYAHRAIDDLGIDAWRVDWSRCQGEIERITQRAPRHYRYPFLRTGRERALRDAGFVELERAGLKRVPVTIDTSDWALVQPYTDALAAGDAARAAAIADAYVEHVLAAARRASKLLDHLKRPEAPQIVLLHGNALAADHLGRVLRGFESEGFRFVSIDEALRDPLYAEPDHYVGGIGLSWLYRIAGGDSRAWSWDAAQAHALAVRFGIEKERAQFDLDVELSIRSIAPNTWIVVDKLPWPANSLVARMADGSVILVGTPYTDASMRSVLDWIGARFGPVPLIEINNHFHPDSVGGNRALRAAGARIIGSEQTARLVTERAAAIREQMSNALADRPELAARFTRYDPLPPTERFEPERGLALKLGGEEVRIFHPGPAHSPDNVVVHFPSRGLVFGGCLIGARDHIGNVADANLSAWPDAIERVRALHPKIVVPGHGDRTDPDLLDHTLELVKRANRSD